jgi:hypothetical protein
MPVIKGNRTMKTLLIALLLTVSVAHAAVFAFVQSKSQSGNSALAFTSNNTAGNIIYVFVSTTAVTAMTDTNANTYQKLDQLNGGGPQIQIWVALNIAAGANSVTATGLAASGSGSSIAIAEYSHPASFNLVAGLIFTDTVAPTSAAAETLSVMGIYDFHSSHAWTGTNLTIRETTTESGGQTLAMGDNVSATVPLGTAFTFNSCSQGGSCLMAWGVNTQAAGGSTASPSASAFVGEQ